MKIRFLILILWLVCIRGSSATINAASPNSADVTTAITASSNGDEIVVPLGTAQWTQQVNVAKGIWLHGAGIGSTVIQDYSTNNSGTLLNVTCVANFNTRISGFEFQNGNGVGSGKTGGFMPVSGVNTNGSSIRIDHCFFNSIRNTCIFNLGAIGVVDHCRFILYANTHSAFIWHENWDGATVSSASWHDPIDWTTTNVFCMEDCWHSFTNAHYAATDSSRGARFIVRYSQLTNSWCEMHGGENRSRGARAATINNNTFVSSLNGFGLVNVRSGTGRIYSNNATGYSTSRSGRLNVDRLLGAVTDLGAAQGTNAWDLNDATGIFDSGTHTGTNNATVLVDGTKSWASTQFYGPGYELRNMSKSSSNINAYGTILTNTSTTITYLSGLFTAGVTFNTGDAYEIRKVTQTIDESGTGNGDAYTGTTPQWLNETFDPWYSWSNTVNGSNGSLEAGVPMIVDGINMSNNAIPTAWVSLNYPHPLVTAQDAGSATIGVSPSSLNFSGTIPNSTTNLTFVVTNTGSVFLDGTASCSAPFIISSGGSYSISPNGSAFVTVTFSPVSNGTFSGTVTCTGGGGATVSLSGSQIPVTGTKISGNVTISGATVIK